MTRWTLLQRWVKSIDDCSMCAWKSQYHFGRKKFSTENRTTNEQHKRYGVTIIILHTAPASADGARAESINRADGQREKRNLLGVLKYRRNCSKLFFGTGCTQACIRTAAMTSRAIYSKYQYTLYYNIIITSLSPWHRGIYSW